MVRRTVHHIKIDLATGSVARPKTIEYSKENPVEVQSFFQVHKTVTDQ